jgi:SAM-dependent methyltransferase
MEQTEAMALIGGGIETECVQHWADLGCGSGTFTKALAELLAWSSYIHAIDKDTQHLPPMVNEVSIGFRRANFIKDQLILNGLDGILMANSLHYVRDKACLLQLLEECFRSDKRFVIVEYENRWPSPWVPYPIPYVQLAKLAVQLGYRISKIDEVASRFGGSMYSALLQKGL